MAFSPTTMATQTSINTARELYELKQKAVSYYDQNGVPKKMEEVLNSTFFDNPDDVYGHLANYFEKFAKIPTIAKLKARQALDSKGQPTLQTEVFCTVKNKIQLGATLVSPTPNSSLPDNAKAEDTEPEEQDRLKGVAAAVSLVTTDINNRLSGLDPTKQSEIDEVVSKLYEELKAAEEERSAKEAEEKTGEEPGSVREAETSSQASAKKGAKGASAKKGGGKSATVIFAPAEPPEKFLPGCNAVAAVSQAVCTAGAYLHHLPLYEHIATLRYGQAYSELCVPLPMVTIIQSGRAALGKSNCIKEFMVVPKPGMPLAESLPLIQKIYNYVGKSFFTKGGVAAKLVNDVGAFCPAFDRPEQGLDLLQEAITNSGLTVGEDFFLAINCAGHELFDYDPSAMKEVQAAFPGQDMHKEKGKYEIFTGQQKIAEDMVEFWAELIGRYPSIIAVIDPMRKQENEHWMRLSERISEQCYMVANHAYHRPGLLKNEELTEAFQTSGIVFKLDRLNTVSDVLQAAQKMQEAGNQVIMSTCYGESTDTFIADFAVGVKAKFIKLGAPVRGERTAQFNRLLQIENMLEMSGRLGVQSAYAFPHLVPPPLPEPVEGEEEVPAKKEPAPKKK